MTWKIFDKLFFMGPTGLGDYFVINGIINHFADRCHELHLPISANYKETLENLYGEHPNIITVPIWPDEGTYKIEDTYCKEHNLSRVLRTPTWWGKDNAGQGVSPLWDQQMYTFFELPFHMRWSNFRLPKNIYGIEEVYNKVNPNNEPYILVHRGMSSRPEGLPINITGTRNYFNLDPSIKIIELTTPLSINMLDYLKLIENAKEIHCIDSSFFHFVGSLVFRIKALLFYHDIRRTTFLNVSNEWNKYRWNIVQYPERLV